MDKKINIFANKAETTIKIKKQIIPILERYGYVCSETYDDTALFNLIIGGDGTFINACHASGFSDIPFVGINTGHLGFYQEVQPDELEMMAKKLVEGNYTVQEIKLIDCLVVTDSAEYNYLCVNELVLKAKYTSIIHFNMYVNNILLQKFAGDGVIFSTPSGSTAYSLSAGGAILYQDLKGFQITPMAPIRSSLHRSLDKSLIVPEHTNIKLITSRREESFFALGIDGILQEFEDINNITVSLADKSIKKLVFDQNWYWKNIKDKLI